MLTQKYHLINGSVDALKEAYSKKLKDTIMKHGEELIEKYPRSGDFCRETHRKVYENFKNLPPDKMHKVLDKHRYKNIENKNQVKYQFA